MNNEQNIINIYNDVINFSIDEITDPHDAVEFLNMWREGDWSQIKELFPSFDLSGITTFKE
jgi:hypothetical protein